MFVHACNQRACAHAFAMSRSHRPQCAGNIGVSIRRRNCASANVNLNNEKGSPKWGSVSVPEGERYAFWSRVSGTCTQVDGPKQIWSLGSFARPLTLYKASPNQYLKVCFRDGNVDYARGPTSMWEDPLRHSRVDVLQSLEVSCNEAVVVYREEQDERGQKEIQRSILRGPALYAPSGLEWLHTFLWHGTDKSTLMNPVQVKLPGLLCFQKLRLLPDQIYFDTQGVRTRDDALITVKVMIFCQLVNLEKMLDSTHDPVSEFINALGADIIEFSGCRSFEQFKVDAEDLNSLTTYSNLVGRANAIGFEISEVVFRGYLASSKLQQMHDEAIQKRTELVLQKETQEQEQDLKDFKLKRDSERAEKLADFKMHRAAERQKLEKESVEHQQQIHEVETESRLKREHLEHQQQIAVSEELHAQRLRQQKEEHARAEDHYSGLRRLGVDLSRYLAVVARGKLHRVIEVDNAGSGGVVQPAAQLHVHCEDKSPSGEAVGR